MQHLLNQSQDAVNLVTQTDSIDLDLETNSVEAVGAPNINGGNDISINFAKLLRNNVIKCNNFGGL